MCGFVGIAAPLHAPLPESTQPALAAMSLQIQHRGPDDHVVYAQPQLALAFRRLAIIDVAGGRQPFLSEDEDVVAVVNGEIFNHRALRNDLQHRRFRSESDCEVVLHLYCEYGPQGLEKLRGMFALAIWDRRQQRVVLARDPFGIKPLYYAWSGGQLHFASEIKALIAHPSSRRSVDWSAALSDPIFSYLPGARPRPPDSYFEGIHHFPAASIGVASLDEQDVRIASYWKPDLEPRQARVGDDHVGDYRRALTASVAANLMSDVPIAIMLSGGIDSLSIAALAADADVPSFTIRTASTVGNGDAAAAEAAARYFGFENHQLDMDLQTVPAPDRYCRLLWLLETPLCAAEQYLKHELYRAAKELYPGLKVMLLGQGSDEFNGGYSSQYGDSWDDFMRAQRFFQREAQVGPSLAFLERRLGVPVVRDSFVELDDVYERYVAIKHRDLQMYNCWHEDRTAAGHGVENRVPFLDREVVGVALGVPASERAALLWDKSIQRRAMAQVLERFANRPKIAFAHGRAIAHTRRWVADLLLQDNAALVERAIRAPGFGDVFNPRVVRGLVNRCKRGQNLENINVILRIVNLGLLQDMTRRASDAW